MKTKEELNTLKDEFEALNAKLSALSEDELEQVTGGRGKNGNPVLVSFEEASAELIGNPDTPGPGISNLR